MIRQDADGDGLERSALLNDAIKQPQAVNLVDEQVARSIGENDRKEECSPANFHAAILRHKKSYNKIRKA
jgi:hypothetical protein